MQDPICDKTYNRGEIIINKEETLVSEEMIEIKNKLKIWTNLSI